MTRTALYAGSFDPITRGHLDIIERASHMFDSITVGVLVNNSKVPLLTLDERMDIVQKVTSHLSNVEVECFGGLLADYVNQKKFSAVIRGLRATTDFEYEIQMAQMNDRLFTGDTETIFLMTNPEYSFISSSLVKEVASLGGDVQGLLPGYALDVITRKLRNRK
ncbi:MAG: pantetheine-phosphate adenylyltransferase [Eubacteriales bacterium]|nr:pantetheine-phosphate adenylyltransferase [Eubacteriales bacterium]